jgi:hypothetical protein
LDIFCLILNLQGCKDDIKNFNLNPDNPMLDFYVFILGLLESNYTIYIKWKYNAEISPEIVKEIYKNQYYTYFTIDNQTIFSDNLFTNIYKYNEEYKKISEKTKIENIWHYKQKYLKYKTKYLQYKNKLLHKS